MVSPAKAARWFRGAALAGACAALAGPGCGGEEPKPAPTPSQIDGVSVAVSDIVVQCGSVRRGFIAGVDAQAIEEDVGFLADLYGSVDVDAEFRSGSAIPDATTTVRKQSKLAAEQLERDCAAEQAEPLRDAMSEE